MGRRTDRVREYLECIKKKYNTKDFWKLDFGKQVEILNSLYHKENLSIDSCAKHFLKMGLIRFNNETRKYEVVDG